MANAGRILIMPKGNWSADTDYKMLDLVYHNGTSWIARQDVAKGIEPSEASKDYWQQMSDVSIANNLSTTGAGKVLDARQGKELNNKKQERKTSSVVVDGNSSYTLTMEYAENCLLFTYIDEMHYSALFTCCGINQHAYSIIKLNETIYSNSFDSEIGEVGGVNVNQITFTNNTDKSKRLTFIKIPFNYLS